MIAATARPSISALPSASERSDFLSVGSERGGLAARQAVKLHHRCEVRASVPHCHVGARSRLLVLDTNKYQKLFDALLGHDYELLATDNAVEALLIASSQQPDLMLLSHSKETPDSILVGYNGGHALPSLLPPGTASGGDPCSAHA